MIRIEDPKLGRVCTCCLADTDIKAVVFHRDDEVASSTSISLCGRCRRLLALALVCPLCLVPTCRGLSDEKHQ